MALSALPSEILSRICRFIVLDDDPSNWSLPQDLKSLRLSCKSVYQKTLFDTGVVYGRMLDDLQVNLTYKSLGALFSISSIPYFRDRLREITFNGPYAMDYGGRATIYNANLVYGLHLEDLDAFADSPEAINILTATFKNLANSSSLLVVHLYEKTTYPAIHTALKLGSFPRRILRILPELDNPRQPPDDRSLLPIAESPYLVSCIAYEATSHEHSGERGPSLRRGDVVGNESGRHYSGYKSVTHSLSELAAKLSGLEKITFRGCDTEPRLRLCHGCEDMWARLFAKNTYAHLTHLELIDGYVSGSRLRGFIKRHAGTLQQVMFDWVFLTDSTWRSIAQGLQKCPNLDYLNVGPDISAERYRGSLRQKHAAPLLTVSLPTKYTTSVLDSSTKKPWDATDIDIILRNKEDVAHWLDVFVKYFTTNRSEVGDLYGADSRDHPIYHEARTFLLPGHKTCTSNPRSQAKIALDKYLEVDEGA